MRAVQLHRVEPGRDGPARTLHVHVDQAGDLVRLDRPWLGSAMKSPGVSRMSRIPRRPIIRPTEQSTNHDPPIQTRDVTGDRGPSTSICQGR